MDSQKHSHSLMESIISAILSYILVLLVLLLHLPFSEVIISALITFLTVGKNYILRRGFTKL